MAEETGITAKSMLIGTTDFAVTDTLGVGVVFADYYTELRMSNGIVHISLAASVVDAQNRPELQIVSRIRMPLETLANINTGLQRIREQLDEQAAKAKETAN